MTSFLLVEPARLPATVGQPTSFLCDMLALLNKLLDKCLSAKFLPSRRQELRDPCNEIANFTLHHPQFYIHMQGEANSS